MNIQIKSWHECKSLLPYHDTGIEPCISSSVYGLGFCGAIPEYNAERCVILSSRLPRKLPADSQCLISLREAVEFAHSSGLTLVSSTGTLGWEYTTWYAARMDVPIWLVLPPIPLDRFPEACEQYIVSYKLNRDRTSFLLPLTEEKLKKRECQFVRDMVTVLISHHRLVVYIRPNGNWMHILENCTAIDNRFIAQRPKRYVEPWRRDKGWMAAAADQDWNGFLFHWTRGTYGPWPGEAPADYFEALTTIKSGNPRDGLSTLAFIAASGIIRGEGRMIRGGTPMVSFTNLKPDEIISLIEYRAGLGRWNFEPYGIAISSSTLRKLGARRVIYGDKNMYDRLSPQEQPYYQYIGSTDDEEKQERWKGEEEYRLTGDLDLMSIKEDVILITPTMSEAEALQSSLPYRVCSLERGRI